MPMTSWTALFSPIEASATSSNPAAAKSSPSRIRNKYLHGRKARIWIDRVHEVRAFPVRVTRLALRSVRTGHDLHVGVELLKLPVAGTPLLVKSAPQPSPFCMTK